MTIDNKTTFVNLQHTTMNTKGYFEVKKPVLNIYLKHSLMKVFFLNAEKLFPHRNYAFVIDIRRQ